MANMNKTKASFLVWLLLLTAPPITSAQNVCDLLKVGTPAASPPPPERVDPPDISKLFIQIYTTRPLDFNESDAVGHTHRCAVARDLAEVDVMMRHIGFGGYVPAANPTNVPLLENAYIQYISSPKERERIRKLARALIHPDGKAKKKIDFLKNNSAMYDPEVLNVYFVHFEDVDILADNDDVPFEVRGMHIRNEEGESEMMIFYGDAAFPQTLAHEFGHALSAGHVNFWDVAGQEWCTKYLPHPGTDNPMINMECEFTYANYMWAGSKEERKTLGEPQKERMMRNRRSVIYQFSRPPEADELDCSDFNSDPQGSCSRLKELP